MSGRFTTHVLDTARGRPAVGVEVALARLGPDGHRTALVRTVTDADGRTGAPLLEGDAFTGGTYELVFDVGAYFAAHPLDPAAPDAVPYLDLVPVRVTVAEGTPHLHVALLVSPWSYTTYRGS